MSSHLRTLIISRPDRLGDVIITTSCLPALQQKFPNATIHFLADEKYRDLVPNFIAAPIPADAIIHFHPHAGHYHAAHRLGIPIRIGYKLGRLTRLLTHAFDDRRAHGQKHEAEYNFDLLAPLGITPPSELRYHILHRPTLPPYPSVVLNPTAHSPVARWPLENFITLAQRLDGNVTIISEERLDFPVGDNLSGQTTLSELAALLTNATVLVTRDTALPHLAAAIGCPVVVLFGRTEPIYGPTRWRPLGDRVTVLAATTKRHWWESRTAFWKRSYASITVEQVLAAITQLASPPRVIPGEK